MSSGIDLIKTSVECIAENQMICFIFALKQFDSCDVVNYNVMEIA